MQELAIGISCEQKPEAKSVFSAWSNKLLSTGIIIGTLAADASAKANAAEKRMGIGILFGTFVAVGAFAAWQKMKESRKNKKKKE